MITGITVKNFGCFGDHEYTANLHPLTFLVGPNNIGKSTILAAYATAAQQGFGYPLSKFQSYDDAVFSRKLGSELYIIVNAEFDGKKAQRVYAIQSSKPISGLPIRNFPSAGAGLVKLQAGTVGDPEAQAKMQQAVSDTWYLMSERTFFPLRTNIGGPTPRLDGTGQNSIQFLLERYTSRDPGWAEAEKWLGKVDTQMATLKSPLRGTAASIETTRSYGSRGVDVNISYQGGGIQRALQIISAVVFSPPGSTIIVEEPEMNLHVDTQEVILDLFNTAVSKWGKQIIITTHSWDMVLLVYKDVGMQGSGRGKVAVKTDGAKFGMASFERKNDDVVIEDYHLDTKKFSEFQSDFHRLWG